MGISAGLFLAFGFRLGISGGNFNSNHLEELCEEIIKASTTGWSGVEVLRALWRVVGAGAGRGSLLQEVPSQSGGLARTAEEAEEPGAAGSSADAGRRLRVRNCN